MIHIEQTLIHSILENNFLKKNPNDLFKKKNKTMLASVLAGKHCKKNL